LNTTSPRPTRPAVKTSASSTLPQIVLFTFAS
jgi:hypothetical protein